MLSSIILSSGQCVGIYNYKNMYEMGTYISMLTFFSLSIYIFLIKILLYVHSIKNEKVTRTIHTHSSFLPTKTHIYADADEQTPLLTVNKNDVSNVLCKKYSHVRKVALARSESPCMGDYYFNHSCEPG